VLEEKEGKGVVEILTADGRTAMKAGITSV
jgi:hypothetical protein